LFAGFPFSQTTERPFVIPSRRELWARKGACFNGASVKTATTAILLATVLALAGCGGSAKESAPPTTTAAQTQTKPSGGGRPAGKVGPCVAAPPEVERKLARKVVLQGAQLSNVKAVGVPTHDGLYFVSAEVKGGGLPHSVATWMVGGLDGSGSAYAIDDTAALISEYGAATGKYPDLTIDAPGVQKSRVCSGGPGTPTGQSAPIPGGNTASGQ
jgi:hypothetical protein